MTRARRNTPPRKTTKATRRLPHKHRKQPSTPKNRNQQSKQKKNSAREASSQSKHTVSLITQRLHKTRQKNRKIATHLGGTTNQTQNPTQKQPSNKYGRKVENHSPNSPKKPKRITKEPNARPKRRKGAKKYYHAENANQNAPKHTSPGGREVKGATGWRI